jgi:hypothetical protein
VFRRLALLITALFRDTEEAPDILDFATTREAQVQVGEVLILTGVRPPDRARPGDPVRFLLFFQNLRDQPTRLSFVFCPTQGPEVSFDLPVGGAEVGFAWQDSTIPAGVVELRFVVVGRAESTGGRRIRPRGARRLGWREERSHTTYVCPLGEEVHATFSPPAPSSGRRSIWRPGATVEQARERFLDAAVIAHLCLRPRRLPAVLREAPERWAPWQRWVLVLPALMEGRCKEWPVALQDPCPAGSRTAIATWWSATDRESAWATLQRLADGLHGPQFDAARAEVARLGAATATSAERLSLVAGLDIGEIHPAGIRAWDVGRIVSLTQSCYAAGFVTEAEAWRWLRLAAREAQASYDGWEAWGRSWLLGRRFWAGDDPALADPNQTERLEVLLRDPASPWQRAPWSDGRGAL